MMPPIGEPWQLTNVQKIATERIMISGLDAVARFVLHFARKSFAAHVVKPGMLYTIRGRGGQYVTKVDKWIKSADHKPGSADQQFFVIENGDPRDTVRVVCNSDRGRRWTLVDVATGLHVLESKEPEGDLTYSMFRFRPVGWEGWDGWVQIEEFTRNEHIAERHGQFNWNEHLCRWGPNTDPTQLFYLEKVGPVDT